MQPWFNRIFAFFAVVKRSFALLPFRMYAGMTFYYVLYNLFCMMLMYLHISIPLQLLLRSVSHQCSADSSCISFTSFLNIYIFQCCCISVSLNSCFMFVSTLCLFNPDFTRSDPLFPPLDSVDHKRESVWPFTDLYLFLQNLRCDGCSFLCGQCGQQSSA